MRTTCFRPAARSVAAAVALFLASVAHAQFSSSVQGTVEDPSGAGVAKAQVHLLNLNTQVTSDTTSGNTGDFSFVSLAPGPYRISAEAPGSAKARWMSPCKRIRT